MKIGIFLTGQHPPGSDMVAELEGQYAMTRLARDRGWDAVAHRPALSERGRAAIAAGAVSGAARSRGGRDDRHRRRLAGDLAQPGRGRRNIASLDAIWRGNFVFGVGLGYREVEFDAFGVPRGQRVRRFEQCLEIVKRLWTEDGVTFRKRHLQIGRTSPRPAGRCKSLTRRSGSPPTATPRVSRAARIGDSLFVNPHATMPRHHAPDGTLPRRTGPARQAVAAGDCRYLREIYCAKDKRTALEMAGPYLAEKYRTYASGARTRFCRQTIRSASRSMPCCATALSSAAPRNAGSNCARAGRKPGPTF